MKTAFTTKMSVPMPIPTPPGKRNASIASQVKSPAKKSAKYQKYRWMFCRTSGKRVSPV